MAQKMTGALVFDERTDRYDIRFDLNSYASYSLPASLKKRPAAQRDTERSD